MKRNLRKGGNCFLILCCLVFLVTLSVGLQPSTSNPLPSVEEPTSSNRSSSRLASSSTPFAPSCDETTSATSPYESLGLDIDRLRETIRAGRVYQQLDFLSPEQVSSVLEEIADAERSGAFAPSGLSNTARKQQGFGNRDRQICPVPWWAESLVTKGDDSGTRSGTGSGSIAASGARRTVGPQLQRLRLALADLLDRPTMGDGSLAHECYYSTASEGSSLSRHMDERHEELKGAKGWLLPSRRSLSWLVYLSDEDWTLDENGGALRSFPQSKVIVPSSPSPSSSAATSHHEGNLQVGWLLGEGADGASYPDGHSGGSRPVYLDSWYPVGSEFCCVLYKVDDENERILLTKPWLNEALGGTITVADFLKRESNRKEDGGLFLNRRDAHNFALLEDRTEWDDLGRKIPMGAVPVDISPVRGSLVVFDSVMVPHQVEKIHQGRRVALAGWFHEATQSFPEDVLGSSQ